MLLRCHSCAEQIDVVLPLGRRDECPKCAAELRCCLQCKHFDEHAASKCREPQAEVPREKNRANFCDFFSATDGKSASGAGAQKAKAALEALFKKPS